MSERRAPAGDSIEMPIDRIAEFESAISEKIESAVGSVVGGNQYGLTLIDVCGLYLFRNPWIEDPSEELCLRICQKASEAF